jgi:hypothetical protein
LKTVPVENTLIPIIVVTEGGRAIEVLLAPINALFPVLPTKLPSIAAHEKASYSIVITLSGTVIEDREVRLEPIEDLPTLIDTAVVMRHSALVAFLHAVLLQ